MSALHIIVGGWLVLNAVVVVALMSRRGRGDEIHDRLGDLAAVGTSTHKLGCDVVSHVEGPPLGSVESDDADPRRTLAPAVEQVADQPVGVGHVGNGPGQTELADKVIEDESSRLANPVDSPSQPAAAGPS